MRRATAEVGGSNQTIINFYPRSPCGERLIHPRLCCVKLNFYPRSPCGERPPTQTVVMHKSPISIHALLAESDYLGARKPCDVRYFYPRSPCGERHNLTQGVFNLFTFLSTLSLRRATTWQRGSRVTYVISIHALLAESDGYFGRLAVDPSHFYPRSPCGERRAPPYNLMIQHTFLSTLSLRRATVFVVGCAQGC